MGTLEPHYCIMGSNNVTSSPIVAKNMTDRHGRTHKVFFTHARARRTPKNTEGKCLSHKNYAGKENEQRANPEMSKAIFYSYQEGHRYKFQNEACTCLKN
jgi:hypothetical protein